MTALLWCCMRGSSVAARQPDYPVTVISVHQRSLINVDDPTSTGATVRLKREAQAEYLATLIQGYQAAGEHVVTVGDYNVVRVLGWVCGCRWA